MRQDDVYAAKRDGDSKMMPQSETDASLSSSPRLGRFELRERLGRGGYGEVFRAYDPRLQREVALKVLHASDDSARLLREGRAAASIAHPNVVSMFDIGEVDGRAYLAMELLRGRTLRSYVGDDDVDLKTKLAWLVMVARALEAAHARGIVHRDVKPDNVFVTEDGVIKVLDFGIARQAVSVDREVATRTFDPMRCEDVPLLEALTAHGVVHGTPDYMAPEQLRGERVTAAADQFAWGVMAYELIEGRRPWVYGDAVRQIEAVLFEEPPRMRRVRGRVAGVVKRALEKDAKGRFRGMGDVAARLGRITSSVERAGLRLFPLFTLVAVVCLGVATFRRSGRETMGVKLSVKGAGAKAALAPQHPASAVASYQAAKRALFDSSRTMALQEFNRAIALDPNYPEAHFWWVIAYAFLGDEVSRDHFARALAQRAMLPAKESKLLSAVEPWSWLPPDKDEVERRLSALARQSPDDAEVLVVLSRFRFMSNEYRGAIEAATSAIARDPSLAYAVRVRGLSLIRAGETSSGIADLEKCTEISPAATSCLDLLHDYLASEGRCIEAASITRRLIAIEPQNPEWYFRLANDLYMSAADEEAIALALEQGHSRTDAEERPVAVLSHAFSLAVLRGDSDSAEKLGREWLSKVQDAPDDDAHSVPTLFLTELFLETNNERAATMLTDAYLRSTNGWTHTSLDFEESFFIAQLRYLGGGMSRGDYADLRNAWVSAEKRKAGSEWPLIWAIGYAQSSTDSATASEALANLPEYGMPDPLMRKPRRDFAIGRTYALLGRTSEARQFLQRAASACTAIDAPFYTTRANVELGQLLEAMKDLPGACQAYRVAAARWGRRSTRFAGGRKAQERYLTLGCEREALSR